MKRVVTLLFLFTLVTFLFCPNSLAERWTFLGKNEIGSFFYDEQSITRNSDGTTNVYVKVVYTEFGIEIMKSVLGKKADKLKYSINLDKVNCLTQTYSILEITCFSVDNKVIVSTAYQDGEKFSMKDGTPAGSLYLKVCGIRI